MRYGFWLPVFGGWLRNVEDEHMPATWPYVRDLAINAETLGYDCTLIAELNLNDIKGPESDSLDAWTTAAALAAVTKKLELMIAVRPTFHNPALLAKQAANIDRISNGRLTLNVVSSWWADEAKKYGIPFDEHDDRYARTSEWLDVLTNCWSAQHTSHAGRFYNIEDNILSPKPFPERTYSGANEICHPELSEGPASSLAPSTNLSSRLDPAQNLSSRPERSAVERSQHLPPSTPHTELSSRPDLAQTLSSRPERSAVERPASLPATNPVLKGTGFSPSIKSPGREGASAPEGSGHPTLYAGGESEAAKNLIASKCDAYLMHGDDPNTIAAKILDMKVRRAQHPHLPPMTFGVTGYTIVRDSEAEAEREIDRITAQPDPSKSPAGFANYQQWITGSKLEKKISLRDYSVSNRGLQSGLVGTPEQVRQRIADFEAAGCSLVLLQSSPQHTEMERFAKQVMQRI